MSLIEYTVELVKFQAVKSFVERHHYSHKTHGLKNQYCFALFRPGKFGIPEMVGAIIYAIPWAPDIASKYYPDDPDSVLELVRLVCIDDTPKNTESYFISRTLNYLKKNTDYKLIVSYADPHFGHEGIVYRASNFIFYGRTGKGSFVMVDGERYSTRILTDVHPTAIDVQARYKDDTDMGVTLETSDPKYIYLYPLDKKLHKSMTKNG